MGFSASGRLDGADDVAVSSKTDGQILVYESATDKWRNAAVPSPADNTITEAKLAVSNSPTSGQVLGWDGSAFVWQAAPTGGSAKSSQSVTYTGTLQVGTGIVPLYNDSGASRTITSVRASVGTAPGGTSILVDVNVAGTTIFPTQSQRPAIASAATTSGAVTRSATWGTNQALTVDIDQVGSTTAGADLIVTIEYS